MIGTTALSMDVIPDDEDDLTLDSSHGNSSADGTVSCKQLATANTNNSEIFWIRTAHPTGMCH
jgi:hypothetical protein